MPILPDTGEEIRMNKEMNDPIVGPTWTWNKAGSEVGDLLVCPFCKAVVDVKYMTDHHDWHLRTEGADNSKPHPSENPVWKPGDPVE